MSRLATKLSIAILVSSGLTTAGIYFSVRSSLESRFADIQANAAHNDLVRTYGLIERERDHLLKQATEWSSWDETFAFLQGTNKNFPDKCVPPVVLNTSAVDLMAFTDKNGTTKLVRASETLLKTPTGLRSLNLHQLSVGDSKKTGPSRQRTSTFSGVVDVGGVPMIIVALPILDTREQKSQVGTFVMGRFISKEKVAELEVSHRVHFDLIHQSTLNSDAVPEKYQGQLAAQRSFTVDPNGADEIVGFAWLQTPLGAPDFIVRTRTSARIMIAGLDTISALGFMLVILSLVPTLGIIALTRHFVIRPVEELRTAVSQVTLGDNLNQELKQRHRDDELGDLARSFQEMLTRLSETRTQLIKTSRDAGMAEVARGVLHNAGNVMNCVTTAVYQLSSQTTAKTADDLKRLNTLLAEQDDLGKFFTQDPRSKQVLPYLKKLADEATNQEVKVAHEIEILNTSTDHLNKIILSQHAFADRAGSNELVNLNRLIDDTILLVQDSFQRHTINFSLKVVEDCYVNTDPVRLSQVLVNFLTNAKDALMENKLGEREISVHLVTNIENQTVCIQVFDNGQGFSKEKKLNMFKSGFTSKLNGLGHGLHYCANTASEYGWSLQAESDGPGKGSVFSITIPSTNGEYCLKKTPRSATDGEFAA